MNEEEFDELFDKAWEDAAKKKNLVPSSEASWKRVKIKLERQRKRKNFFKGIPYIAASFILGAILFSSPTTTNAINPFFEAVKSVRDGVVKIIFGSTEERDSSTEAKTPPPHDKNRPEAGVDVSGGEHLQQEFQTWEEAAKVLSFIPPIVEYIPSDFDLLRVLTISNETPINNSTAVLFYSNQTNKNFNITLRKLGKNEMLSTGSSGSDVQFEELQMNGHKAYLFVAKDGTSSINFMVGGAYVAVLGNLSKDEIIDVAKGIK